MTRREGKRMIDRPGGCRDCSNGGNRWGLTTGVQRVTIGNMGDMPFTEALRRAIRESRLPYLKLEQATGVHRASISRFMAGERSVRLDVADKLAAYFGLRLTQIEKKPTTKKPKG